MGLWSQEKSVTIKINSGVLQIVKSMLGSYAKVSVARSALERIQFVGTKLSK